MTKISRSEESLRWLVVSINDGTWRAFEFEGAVRNSLGEMKYFYQINKNWWCHKGLLINIHDVGKAHLQILLSDWTDIGDVITLWNTYWWCHSFMLSVPEVFTQIFLQLLQKTTLWYKVNSHLTQRKMSSSHLESWSRVLTTLWRYVTFV